MEDTINTANTFLEWVARFGRPFLQVNRCQRQLFGLVTKPSFRMPLRCTAAMTLATFS